MDLQEALQSIASTEQVQVFEAVYDEICNHPEGLTKQELCRETFGLEEGYFSDRIFDLFDTNHSGRVDKKQFVLGLSGLISRDEGEFIDFLFDLFDADGSGELDKEELFQGMLASLRANKLSLAQRIEDFFDGNEDRHAQDDVERARELAEKVFDAFNEDHKGLITKEEFKRVYLKHMGDWGNVASPLTKTRITTRQFQQYLKKSSHAKNNPWGLRKRPLFRRARLWIIQNPQRAFWFSMWLLINIGLFLWKFLEYQFARPEAFQLFGYCISFARGSAECLKFNVAVTLMTMCRGFLTWLRNLGNGEALEVINLDDNVATHRLGGVAIFVLTLVHTAAHICDFHIIGRSNAAEVNAALGKSFTNVTKPSEVELWFMSWQGLTGLGMLFCIAIAYPGILDWMRKRGHFNIFWGTHQALIVFTVIMMIHGAESLLEPFTAVYWVGGPFLLYLSDRLRRAILTFKRTRTGIYAPPKALPPNVLELKMYKNDFPNYKAGQYVYLNVPKISFFEWHPFTLTSAPEDDYLSVHMRSVGGWTNAFHKEYPDGAEPEALPSIFVDGPYGAPSQAYERYKVCIFIAAGIGITPYAGILSHILNQVRDIRRRSSVGEQIDLTSLPVKKIYLFWTTRDEGSVAWFDKLLQDFYSLDVSELIEIHHYYTSAYEKGDFRNSLIGLAHTLQGVQLDAENEGKLFNLNRSRYYSHYGRPDWNTILPGVQKACSKIDSKCGIFATVPPRFSSIVRQAARTHSNRDFKFTYTSENF